MASLWNDAPLKINGFRALRSNSSALRAIVMRILRVERCLMQARAA
ncbi:hypothetical protein PZ895_09335 [Mesorhizobium sp. YIM 152430]|nr:hypothetical protein [Mesorhizobium sp. YIM 152430]MDF1599981.1 hypothetical protein [Mesorhizobium sp. YIM 152430]